jgi:gas vesicle protein
MAKSTKILMALVAGAAAGVAIGMLLASKEGSEIRKNLTDKAKKLADELLEKAEATVDKMNDSSSKT